MKVGKKIQKVHVLPKPIKIKVPKGVPVEIPIPVELPKKKEEVKG